MHKPNVSVSIADLSAAGIRLRPYEAATIVRELVLRVASGELAGVPSSHVVRLASSGAIYIEGPVGAGGPSVARAAQLLDALLPPAEAASQFRVPGGLRLIVARAMGALDLPPFTSLEAFADALSRFASSDAHGMVTNLVVAWEESARARLPQAEPPASPDRTAAGLVEPFAGQHSDEMVDAVLPTVSDVRRARRATGLTLSQMSMRTGIPVALLRQLEWGYLMNWPAGRHGRRLLKRYARAAGLDRQFVLSTVTPLIAEAEKRRTALVPQPVFREILPVEDPIVDVEIIRVVQPEASLPAARSRWTTALAATAIPALLMIALFPAWWASSSGTFSMIPARPGVPSSQARASAGATAGDASAPEPPPSQRSPAEEVGTKGSNKPEASADAVDPPTDKNSEGLSYRTAADDGGPLPVAGIGTATFYPADEADGPAIIPANSGGREAVLRITRIVDDSADNLHLRVSPDRGQIAFDSDRDGIRGVYVADGDGKNVRRVSGEGFGAFPSWSPDGRMLAFVREDTALEGAWNVWTLDLTTGELSQVTRHSTGQPRGASWFPDNRRLAYSHAERLILSDLQTGAERTFASPRRGRAVRSAAVSPDGRLIMFHVERDGAWLLDLRDGSMRRVLEDPTADEYTWSPDGRRVAYYSRKAAGWSIWVMAPR